MTAVPARQVRAGQVVRDAYGRWQTVAATEHEAGGHTVLRYADGTEEEGSGDTPRTVLPKLTDPQAVMLRHVATGAVAQAPGGAVRLLSASFPNTLRRQPLERLVSTGLVKLDAAQSCACRRDRLFQLTAAGRAYLDGAK